jgi:hypothetical protein
MKICEALIDSLCRRLVAAALLTVFGACVPAILSAQEEIAVSGEIVDLACYLSKGSRGMQHKACAQLCAKKGLPIGVLTPEGDVFLLIEDHDNPDPYQKLKKLAGENADVKGKRFSKGGVASILVSEASSR